MKDTNGLESKFDYFYEIFENIYEDAGVCSYNNDELTNFNWSEV